VLQRVADIGPAGHQRREQAGDDRDHERRQQRGDEHRQVDREVGETRDGVGQHAAADADERPRERETGSRPH
jgi:hypothetical protein